MQGGGWDLVNTKVLNSGEAFCSFTLLYWIEADTNPGLLSPRKEEMGPNGCGLNAEG